MFPTIPCAQGVILLGAGVLDQGDPALPAPGQAVQAGVRGAAPATSVLLEVTGCWEERRAVRHPVVPGRRRGTWVGHTTPSFGPGQAQGRNRSVPISTAYMPPQDVPSPPSDPRCPCGVGSHLARGRLHPTRAGHPARCTRGHPQLPLPQTPPGQGDMLRLAASMHPLSPPAAPSNLPCLTCQLPSGWMVTWLRCQPLPSMVLTFRTFVRTLLCSTNTRREPAQGTQHGGGGQGCAVWGPPIWRCPQGSQGMWCSPGVPALSWYQKARHWVDTEGG